MTEQEWLSEQDPYPLAKHLCQARRLNRTKAGRRKFWLFGCACCRRAWNLFEAEPVCAAIVVAAEQFADGNAPFADVQNYARRLPRYKRSEQHFISAARTLADTNALVAAIATADACAFAVSQDLVDPNEITRIWSHEQSQAAHLLRCIFGNPFRPVTLDPAWRTSDAIALARGIYDERAFDRMPILADALQDAGCDSDDILNHCRDTNTPHARGCWVVDLVLGK